MDTAGRNTVARRVGVVAAVGIFVLFGAGSAAAHEGGTDANGCHAGPEPYHCHTSSTDNAGGAVNTQAPPSTTALPVQTTAPVAQPDVAPAADAAPTDAMAPEVAGISAEQQALSQEDPELAYTGATEWLFGAIAGILIVLGLAFRSYGFDVATTANIRRHDRRRAEVEAFRARIDEIEDRRSGW